MDDALGDRMKLYESAEAGRRCLPLLPVLVRLDGRSFHRFTADLQRPFDARLTCLMIETARALVRETGATLGYTQSDEITLLLYSDQLATQVFCDGRIHKLVSQTASMATAIFNLLLSEHLPAKAAARSVADLPMFDSRVWTVPNADEAANVFLWRQRDASKNSVSMAARAHFGHDELVDRSAKQMQEMLFAKGVNWNDYPPSFKRGTFVRRRTALRGFAPDEIAALPPRHDARRDPNLKFERAEWVAFDLPPLDRVTNRTAVIFDDAEPAGAA